jgi:PhnB protein
MLSTLICLNGKCREAIEFYKKALNATVNIVIPNKENEALIDHSEIFIHDCLLMLNDFGGSDGSLKFKNEEELKKAYSIMEDKSTMISPMSAQDYTVCQVVFIDKFDVRWGFWV